MIERGRPVFILADQVMAIAVGGGNCAVGYLFQHLSIVPVLIHDKPGGDATFSFPVADAVGVVGVG